MNTLSDIEETIYFFTRNDYNLIREFHRETSRGQKLQWIEFCIDDNRKVLNEYETGIRDANSPLDQKKIHSLKKRAFEGAIVNGNDFLMEKIRETLEKDILLIYKEMVQTEEELMVYRTEDVGGHNITSADIGKIKSFKIIKSTSLTPYQEEVRKDFYRFEIIIPKNNLVLELDRFDTHNEKGEVLLPPTACRITNVEVSANKECRAIIKMEVIGQKMVHAEQAICT